MNNEPEQDKNPAPEERQPATARPLSSGPGFDIEGMEGVGPVAAWLRENGMPILVGVVIAALGWAGWSAYRSHQKAAAITAESMLFSSQTTAQFMEIMSKYPKAPTASLAALSLGSQQFDEGQYDLARATFSSFATAHPGHPLAAAATLGLAQCDEAQLKLAEALKGYEQFTKTETNSFLYAQAVFGRGRCLEQMGRFDDARAVYEDFIAGNPKSPWTARAETALMYVGKAKRAAAKPAPVVALPPLQPAVTTPAPAPVAPVAPAPAAK